MDPSKENPLHLGYRARGTVSVKKWSVRMPSEMPGKSGESARQNLSATTINVQVNLRAGTI